MFPSRKDEAMNKTNQCEAFEELCLAASQVEPIASGLSQADQQIRFMRQTRLKLAALAYAAVYAGDIGECWSIDPSAGCLDTPNPEK